MKVITKVLLSALALGAMGTTSAQTAATRGTTAVDLDQPSLVAPFLPNAIITESFDTPPTPAAACPVGWFCQNNSDNPGATDWFALTNFTTPPFAAQAGANAIAANFEAVASGTGTISVWMVTPVVNFLPGAKLEFWVRDTSDTNAFPDRLQVRVSTAGAVAPNVGSASGDVGDFTTLVLDINPSLNSNVPVCTAGIDDPAGGTIDGMPAGAWCRISVSSLSGIPTSGSGRLAFRYFVTSGGPTGANSNAVVIDTFSFDEGVIADADVSITKSATAASPLVIGSPVTYTLTASNAGPGSASTVVVTDVLPSNLTYVSTTCASATAAGQTFTWNVGTLANGANSACNIVASVNAFGPISNTANITSSTGDPSSANNSGTATLGGAPFPIATQVPSIGTLGMLLLGLILTAAAVVAIRR